MKEMQKTLVICLVAAALAGGAAWSVYRGKSRDAGPAVTTQSLFPELTDATAVTSLKIVKMNEAPVVKTDSILPTIQQIATLELTRQPDNTWLVSSHEDYPAGMMERVAEVASALATATVLGQESDKAGDKERFGVVDPASRPDFGAVGVGTRVTAKAKDKVVADLIIGNQVVGRPENRYVRLADQDLVYEVRIKDVERLSTRFEDWIETRILDVNSSYDIRRVTIHDDTFALTSGPLSDPLIQRRYLMDFVYDNDKSTWNVKELIRWKPKSKDPNRPSLEHDPVPANLTEAEELKTQALSDLTFGLSDLKIVDATTKSARVAQAINRETGEIEIPPLQPGERPLGYPEGFVLLRPSSDPCQVLAAGGRLDFATKDGLEYTLYFGNEAGTDIRGSAKPSDKASEKKPDDKQDASKQDPSKKEPSKKEPEKKQEELKVNRYMFVTVRFNPDLVEKPKLDPLPSEPKVDAPQEKPSVSPEPKDKPASEPQGKPASESKDKPTEKSAPQPDSKEPSAKPDGAPEKKAEAKEQPKTEEKTKVAHIQPVAYLAYQAQDAGKSPESKAADGKVPDANSPEAKAAAEKPAGGKPAEAKSAETKSPEAKPASEQPAEKSPAEKSPAAEKPAVKSDDKSQPKAEEKSPAKPDPQEEARKKAEAERKRIEEENAKKQKEYEEKLDKGRKKVKDLNERFAKWYFVIGEDAYKKLHLTREDVVQKKEKKEDDSSKSKLPPPPTGLGE